MPLPELHARLGNTAIFYIAALALWAFWRFFRRQGVDSNYWGALAIAELLILLQGGLGAYMWLSGHFPAQGGIHFLYGVLSVIGIPVFFALTRGRDDRQTLIVYGAGLLFMVGILIRAITTG
jgi:heme A synthase